MGAPTITCGGRREGLPRVAVAEGLLVAAQHRVRVACVNQTLDGNVRREKIRLVQTP